MAAADNYPQADSESRHNAEVRSAVGGCFPATTFIILTNQKWQLYRLQGTRTNLFGKTPSNTIGSAGNELWGSMDDADKSSAPSIPWPGCMPRRSSCYGRCFARSVPPDAALRLARRKRETSLPRPQSASAIRSGVIRNPNHVQRKNMCAEKMFK